MSFSTVLSLDFYIFLAISKTSKKSNTYIYQVKLFTARWLGTEMTRETKIRPFTEQPHYRQAQ